MSRAVLLLSYIVATLAFTATHYSAWQSTPKSGAELGVALCTIVSLGSLNTVAGNGLVSYSGMAIVLSMNKVCGTRVRRNDRLCEN